jgi:hypothetical protein
MFRLPRSLDPQVAPTAEAQSLQGSRAVYTTHSSVGYLPRDVASLRIRHEQLIRLDFHQLDCSLVGRYPDPDLRNYLIRLLPRVLTHKRCYAGVGYPQQTACRIWSVHFTSQSPHVGATLGCIRRFQLRARLGFTMSEPSPALCPELVSLNRFPLVSPLSSTLSAHCSALQHLFEGFTGTIRLSDFP